MINNPEAESGWILSRLLDVVNDICTNLEARKGGFCINIEVSNASFDKMYIIQGSKLPEVFPEQEIVTNKK